MHSDEAQQLIDFWGATCHQELEIRDDDEYDEGSVVIEHVVDQLVPTLIRAISDVSASDTRNCADINVFKDKYTSEADNGDMNVRKSAEACLHMVAKVENAKIGALVDPLLKQDPCAQVTIRVCSCLVNIPVRIGSARMSRWLSWRQF